MKSQVLYELGWDEFFQAQITEGSGRPMRVGAEYQGLYTLLGETGEVPGRVSGRMRHQAGMREDLPAVGDWVLVQEGDLAIINQVLARKSKFSRKVAGGVTQEQIVAANIDTAFLMTAFDGDFNPRRMERYLVAIWESGASPVIVVNKSDLVQDIQEKMEELDEVAMGVPLVPISCELGTGIGDLDPYLVPGKTVALLGSSGVGKSSLVNHLMGQQAQVTGGTRKGDGKGRHTTTHRQILQTPSGALLIDTPGMRELQFWNGQSGVEDSFGEISQLAVNCRFRDCAHEREPGCAVQEALAKGELGIERLLSYRKLQREAAYQARKEQARTKMSRK